MRTDPAQISDGNTGSIKMEPDTKACYRELDKIGNGFIWVVTQ